MNLFTRVRQGLQISSAVLETQRPERYSFYLQLILTHDDNHYINHSLITETHNHVTRKVMTGNILKTWESLCCTSLICP